MKAAVLTGVQSIELRDVPDPQVPEGGLVIKVENCAICGTDVKMHRYGYAAAQLPLIPGHELAGRIDRSRVDGDDYTEGKKVTINPNIPCGVCHFCRRGLQTACDNLQIIGVHRDGGFARYVMVPAQAVQQGCVFPIPENISNEEAALIDPASCAVNAGELSGIKPEDVVVVIGAGPAGCLNVEVSRAFGASKTILVQRSPRRLEQAAFTGAEIFVNSSEEDAVKRVMQETGGRGADVVIVACASGEAQEQAVKMVSKRGNVNLFGGLPKGSHSIQFDSNLVHYKECFVIGTHGGSNRHCRIALDMIASGRINAKEYVSLQYGLSNFQEALKSAEEKRGLKVFVNPDL
jgi:L-iditol 2-dehydrogenase